MKKRIQSALLIRIFTIGGSIEARALLSGPEGEKETGRTAAADRCQQADAFYVDHR